MKQELSEEDTEIADIPKENVNHLIMQLKSFAMEESLGMLWCSQN